MVKRTRGGVVRSRPSGRVARSGLTWNTAINAFRWANRARRAVRGASRMVRQRASRSSAATSSSARSAPRSFLSTKRYVTTGKIGKKYSRGKKPKYNDFVKKGVVIKNESGGIAAGQECIYVGHYSLPLDRTLAGCSYALARKIMEMNNIYMQDPKEKSAYPNNLVIAINYRSSVGGVIVNSVGTTLSANFSVVSFGDAIGAEICANMGASVNYFEVVKITVDDAVTSENWLTVSGSNIWFDVNGTSNLQMQNRTLANNTTEPTRWASNDITNNPLRGKSYDGVCNLHLLKFIENKATPGAIDSFKYGNSTGVLALESGNGTFTTEMQEMLKKPPIPSAFSNVLRSKYVQLTPGEIRRSTVTSSFRMSLNRLLNVYLDGLRGAANFYTLDDCYIKKGANRFFALEKMCDTAQPDENAGIDVGYEAVNTISCLAHIQKRVNMNTYNL